jgi:flavin reductase (DIM6/NTAB) family NADH-FMN oxidoreductase RutF
MIIDPNDLPEREAYKLVIGSIVPRPIAWVSSMDAEGNLNLAPFSYFTAVCARPMTLVFCPGIHGHNLARKDTWRNIEEVPEFVVNMTNEETAQRMNLSATVLPRGRSEFEWAGVTPAPSASIRVPRVAEAPIAFECVLHQIVVISEEIGGGAAVFGRVQRVYVRDDLLQRGRIDLEAYRPIGRLAGNQYTSVCDPFTMDRVPAPPES